MGKTKNEELARSNAVGSSIEIPKIDLRRLTDRLPKERPRFNKRQVKEVRERLQVSQAVLARLLGVSPAVVRAWEQGYSEPNGAATRLLQIAGKNPASFISMILACATVERRKKLKVSE